jgi:hypothetical protein
VDLLIKLNNMSKILTAEEFLKEKDDYGNLSIYADEIAIVMIEFTKLHVEAALKATREYYEINYDVYLIPENEINVETDIYPLENIK